MIGSRTTRRPSVVVFDYGSGNVRSAVRALERVGADVELTADTERAGSAAGLVVPGVGAFATCVSGIRARGGDSVISARRAGGQPTLGVCVGMQVLFEHGVENGTDTPGLGEWPGRVTQIEAPVLPHMGWNTVDPPTSSTLFDGLAGERFYFVHSYAVREWSASDGDNGSGDETSPRPTWSEHGERFVAAVEDDTLAATQFHPEKSGEAGLHLLHNWVRSL